MFRKAGPFAVPAVLTWVSVALFFSVFIRPGLVDRGRASLESSIDLENYFLPRYALGSEFVFHGHLPVWNRFEYGGIPLLATGQPAALYPPKILLFGLFSPVTAYWIFIVGHSFLLATGFLLFLRDRKITGIPAFVGAMLAVFPVPLLDSNYHPNRIATLAWVPVLYILTERVVRGSVLAFALLALTVAVELTAGYPEVSIDVGLLLAAHAIGAFVLKEWKRPPWQVLPVVGAAFAIGAVAAALQLVPLGELGRVAAREVMAQHGRAAILGGPRTPLLIIPGFVAFVLVGFVVPKGRLGTVGFLICAFVSSGGWRFLRVVPGFGMIRFGFTWMFLAGFFLAWVGAAGCDAVLHPGAIGERSRRVARWVVAAGGVALAVCWALEWRRLAGATSSQPPPWALNVGSTTVAFLGVAGGLSILVTALVAPARAEAWIPCLVLLTIAHLRAYPFGAPTAPFGPPAPKGIVASLHGNPSAIESRVLAPDDILYGYEITDRLPSPLGAEISFMPWRFREIGRELGYITMFALIDWSKVVRAGGFLDAMDVGYLAAPKTFTSLLVGSGYRLLGSGETVGLFENKRHMGHAWVNHGVRTFRSAHAALEYVLGPEFDPRREVVLEETTSADYSNGANLPADLPEHEERTDTTATFEVRLREPGVLVFSESAYPGRAATVDGVPAKILRANYVLCAVELPRGTHRVKFLYDAPSIRWGGRLSAVGCAGILALFFYRAFGKRRTFWAC